MDWDGLKALFRAGKEIGFRLLREDCRHCQGKGLCFTGMSTTYGISCASCQLAALGEIGTRAVKCQPCDGRGIFVFATPQGRTLEGAMLEVLPRVGNEPSTIRVIVPEQKALPAPNQEASDSPD
jgi:hypothetical protein